MRDEQESSLFFLGRTIGLLSGTTIFIGMVLKQQQFVEIFYFILKTR